MMLFSENISLFNHSAWTLTLDTDRWTVRQTGLLWQYRTLQFH